MNEDQWLLNRSSEP